MLVQVAVGQLAAQHGAVVLDEGRGSEQLARDHHDQRLVHQRPPFAGLGQRELRLEKLLEPNDVADATAVALCHYYSIPAISGLTA